jgi:hypothetical protein
MNFIIEDKSKYELIATALTAAGTYLRAAGEEVPVIITDMKDHAISLLEFQEDYNVGILEDTLGIHARNFLKCMVKAIEGYRRGYKDIETLKAMIHSIEQLSKAMPEREGLEFTWEEAELFIISALRIVRSELNLIPKPEEKLAVKGKKK